MHIEQSARTLAACAIQRDTWRQALVQPSVYHVL